MVSPEEIEEAAERIRRGGLVAFPTETVYGLGANALDPDAVRRIYEAKGRPSTSPLIVHVADEAMAREIVSRWPPEASLLARVFWPGSLTLVLPKAASVPDVVTAGLATVGVRVPNHPVALALLRVAQVPIAAPSANRFTELSPTTAQHVREGLGDRVDKVLDGGPCTVGIESTVLSLVNRPELLRPGMVDREQLEALLGPIESAQDTPEGAHASPGMHARHYRPRTRLMVGQPLPDGRGAYLYWSEPLPAEISLQMPDDAVSYASQLYDRLHGLDRLGLDWIAVEPVPDGAAWDGVRDRLRRASSD